MADLSGREIGGCRLIKPIGIGGMGEVYLAEQIRLGNRPVAVKVVQLDDAALGAQHIDDIQRRFTQEAALLGSFSNPHILPVHDAGVEDGMLYLVMEYVPDGSLADAMRPGPRQKLTPPLSPALVADLVGQVATALQYTHDRGVVHRDVKPGNILARQTGDGTWQLLLADYGIAKAMQDAQQKTQVSGTLAYMAPEQFTGAFSPATDQYALAVVAYQLLAGRPPFEGDLATVTQAHLNQPPPSLRGLNPAISPALDAVVLRALAKKPSDRYPQIAAFAQALREAAAQPAAQAVEEQPAGKPARWPLPTSPTSPTPPRKPSVGRAWFAVAAAVVLLIGAGVGADLLHQRSAGPNLTATQTAQTSTTIAAGQSAATQTALARGTQTVVAFVATQTAAAFIPTATATASLADDVTSPPPAPAGANAIVFADAAPTCHGSTPSWQVDNATLPTCPAGGGVLVHAQSTSTLACIEQHTVPGDAYISVLVTPGGPSDHSGAVLGFRQGAVLVGTPTPNVQQLSGVGYFYSVMRGTSFYDLYQFDSALHRSDLTQGVLASGPAADFAMGVLVKGSQITFYVNGQPIGSPITDTQHTQGWISLCTTSDTLFRDVQVYSLAS
jgi:serine/threonine protein kinase